ncbi:oligopeptide ABC transporter permease [Lactobacillus selangorensis]|uniref:Oligopeptide ABC transporter permease n=1 Tax=Lactobacillus selangorensis TaxID=81857 RepID=A0A0R2FM31_9LACO|nr:ABC transporter permease [Lactobacillus selangorensis]KRN29635.1 oligopeptide ABC transporter permease [Lactobacillus selangorensis]KRN33836.1 oligopeptide ABC transporter permease [Lactobacillus selangorensis]
MDAEEIQGKTIKEEKVSAPPSAFQVLLHEFARDKVAMVSLIVVTLIILTVFIGSLFLNTGSVTQVNILDQYDAPGTNGFLLGADEGGHDVLKMLIVGARNSITIAFLVTLVNEGVGIIYGTIAGYFGGKVDNIMMRVVDFVMILPALMIEIVLVTIVPHYNMFSLVWIIAMFSWVGTARLIRSNALSEGQREYVAAAKTSGTSNFKIIFGAVLPNISSLVIVDAALTFAASIGIETGLTFLGYGLPNSTPSLGTLIGYANDPEVITSKWWVWLPAALLLLVLSMGINYIGQALRHAADARQRS